MPLFGSSNKNPSPPPQQYQQPQPAYDNYETQDQHSRKGSIFSRRSNAPSERPSQAPTMDTYNSAHEEPQSASHRGGFFNRGRRSSDETSTSGFSGSGRSGAITQDSSIVGARDKVFAAENAERQADQALAAARAAVREARDHVRMLEREAVEEARRAKMKSDEAKHVSKSARGLGRHG